MVTISVGVATFGPDGNLKTPSQLVNQADEALYRAKAEGRDAVRTAEGANHLSAKAERQ
ncbi:diguanylate cyclase [Rhizobium sp. G21]|nr:diguanylate cyclase [Rhizobium sp. G21]